MKYEIGHYGYNDAGDSIPRIGITSVKGFGLWAGMNYPYHNLCIWIPFFTIFITLPKCFKRQRSDLMYHNFDKFIIALRLSSFGLYFMNGDFWNIRLPFIDICIKKKSKND